MSAASSNASHDCSTPYAFSHPSHLHPVLPLTGGHSLSSPTAPKATPPVTVSTQFCSPRLLPPAASTSALTCGVHLDTPYFVSHPIFHLHLRHTFTCAALNARSAPCRTALAEAAPAGLPSLTPRRSTFATRVSMCTHRGAKQSTEKDRQEEWCRPPVTLSAPGAAAARCQ